MNEDQHEAVVRVVSFILDKIKTQVNESMQTLLDQKFMTEEQTDLVRTMLTEQARFWK